MTRGDMKSCAAERRARTPTQKRAITRHKTRSLVRTLGRVLSTMYHRSAKDARATIQHFVEGLDFGEQHRFDAYVLEFERDVQPHWHPLSSEFKDFAVSLANDADEMEEIIQTLSKKAGHDTSSRRSNRVAERRDKLKAN